MNDTFRIFTERLREGQEEHIQESLLPDFLDIQEAELNFHLPVSLEGTASVIDDALVLVLSVTTEATMPCAICNQNMQVKIFIPHFCHTENLMDIRGGIFDYRAVLREHILLELPYKTECHGGDCPERASLAKYFRKNLGENDGSPT